MELDEENLILKERIRELEKKFNILVSTFQYTGDNTPLHDKLKKEIELYKNLLDNEKFLVSQLKSENHDLKKEIMQLKKWQQNPRNSGRLKREYTEKGINLISTIKFQLAAGKTNRQIMDDLQLSESTYYRYKKLIKKGNIQHEQ